MSQLTELLNENNERIRKEWESLNGTIPEHLYHYTDINALSSIVEKKFFWATHIKFLNDKKELVHAYEVTKNVIDKLLLQYSKNNDIQSFLDDFWKFLNELDMDLYIISLSEEADLLSQWRGYGKKYKSVCMGLNTKLMDMQSDAKPYCMKFFQKVIYDFDQQYSLIESYIGGLCKILSTYPLSTWPTNICEVQAKGFLNLLSRFKHDSWSEEKEWRFVILPEIYDEEMNFKEYIKPKFRSGEMSLIPYLECDVFEGKHGISEVILPQSPVFSSAKKAVEMLFKQEYPAITQSFVRQSRIPIVY